MMTTSDHETFGELLQRLRNQTGRTQEQQAEAVNAASGRDTMTRREISRYENNENIPSPNTCAHIAAACGLPPEHLQRAARQARKARHQPADQENDDMLRRTLLGGAIVGAVTAAEPWGRLAHALTRAKPLDRESAGILTETAGQLHITELTLTAIQLRGRVEAHLDAITSALPRAHRYERELTVAAGETAALAGWLAWDLGDHQAARNYYRVTAECAEAAGHPALHALAFGYASYATSGPRSLELLQQAAQYVRGPGNATAAAWIHGRHAEEAAAAGNETEALRALDRARTAYEYGDYLTEQAWVRFVSPSRMDSLAISVLGRLAHHELHDAATNATNRLGGDLSDAGVVILGDLASALLLGGDVDQGAHVARQFAQAATAKPNTMGRERAAGIAARLPHHEADLADQLHAFAA